MNILIIKIYFFIFIVNNINHKLIIVALLTKEPKLNFSVAEK